MPLVETLPNGLRMVLEEDHRVPRVAFQVLFDAGAAEEPVPGLAHLVEHLMFEGSAGAPGDSYDQALAAVGGRDNAWTDHDHVALTCVVPRGAEDLVLYLEADRLAALTPGPEAVRNQVDVITREREREDRHDARLLAGLLWPEGHPYRRPVMGGDLEALTQDDVSRMYQSLVRGGITVSAVGDFDTARMADKMRTAFGGLPATSPGPVEVSPVVPPPRRVWVEGGVDRPTVYLAWRTVPLGAGERYVLELVATLLEEVEGLDVEAWSGERGGSFVVSVSALRGVGRLHAEAQAALERLRRDGPDEAALARVKARWRAQALRDVESIEGRAEMLGFCLAGTGVADCLPEEGRRRDAVGASEVRDAAARWLSEASGSVLAVVPWGSRAPVPGLGRLE